MTDEVDQDLSVTTVRDNVAMPTACILTIADQILDNTAVTDAKSPVAVTGQVPAGQSDPEPEVERTQKVEAEDATTTGTPGYTLPAAFTPAVLRQLLAAAEQIE